MKKIVNVFTKVIKFLEWLLSLLKFIFSTKK